jgi:ABC-type bacteriocin/lantibiotic exporter with double-glycine peptidase domain
MTHHTKQLCAICCLTAITGLFAALCLLPQAMPVFDRHSEALKQVRAWMRGARFVTARNVILQSRSNDCGAASLKMILETHGVERSISDLASDLQLTARGTSLLKLRLTAAKLGVSAKSWSIRLDDLTRIPLPAIAFINKNHFVVIRRFVAPEVLEIDDPALGKLRWPVRAFQRFWSGETLVFDPAWTPL